MSEVPKASGDAAQGGVRRIGLLFVHGIGEQKRFEHLTNSAREFAELMKLDDPGARVTVVDRTTGWKIPAGAPDPTSLAPVTVSVVSANGRDARIFECHEVWWADLGSRSGVIDSIRFWMWGLGQWCAPVFLDRDMEKACRAHTALRAGTGEPNPQDLASLQLQVGNIHEMVVQPPAVAGQFCLEMRARATLALAALTAFFTLITWSLAKRVFAAIAGNAPSPTLLVQYIGDVRVYESRAVPGQTVLSDPACPVRVAIRRRMVTEMVAMAQRGFDGWYVVAHSLGTVLAYNGLTEIGHALPNYLPETQWRALPDAWKFPNTATTFTKLRTNIAAMAPARPRWLSNADVINRGLLFEKLDGVLTYGSPLAKFAALWPRVVTTGADFVDAADKPQRPFPAHCRWINLAAPQDPVAGMLELYAQEPLRPLLPPLTTISTPFNAWFGLAHLQYFSGFERYRESRARDVKMSIVRWLNAANPVAPPPPPGIVDVPPPRFAIVMASIGYIAIVCLICLTATAVVAAAGGYGLALLGAQKAVGFATVGEFKDALLKALPSVFTAVLSLIVLCGLLRWMTESKLNWRLAAKDADKSPSTRDMLKWQFLASLCAFSLTLTGLAWAAIRDGSPPSGLPDGWSPWLAIAILLWTIGLAIAMLAFQHARKISVALAGLLLTVAAISPFSAFVSPFWLWVWTYFTTFSPASLLHIPWLFTALLGGGLAIVAQAAINARFR